MKKFIEIFLLFILSWFVCALAFLPFAYFFIEWKCK